MPFKPLTPSHLTVVPSAVKPAASRRKPRAAHASSSDLAPEMRWTQQQLADRTQPLAYQQVEAGTDVLLYRWDNACWRAWDSQDMAATALRWLSVAEPKKALADKAMSCARTLTLLARAEAERLPEPSCDTDQPLILGTRSHDVLIQPDGRVCVGGHDRTHGLTALVDADLDLGRIAADGTYTPREPEPGSLWGRYLELVMPNAEVRLLLQEAVGSSLLRATLERIFVLSGDGANGKSTMIHVLSALHSAHASMSLTQLRSAFGLETVIGKSMIMITEAESWLEDAVVQRLKALASRDKMPVDRKFQRAVSVRPMATVFIAANNPLRYADRSDGTIRKFLTIPFDSKIPEQSRIPDFHRRLVRDPREMAVFLDWALLGVIRLLQRGLRFGPMPASVEAITEEHRIETDSVYGWTRYAGARADRTRMTDKAAVYAAYAAWCLDNGQKPHASAAYWRALRAILCERGTTLREERGSVGADGVRARLIGIVAEGMSSRASQPPVTAPPIRESYADEVVPW